MHTGPLYKTAGNFKETFVTKIQVSCKLLKLWLYVFVLYTKYSQRHSADFEKFKDKRQIEKYLLKNCMDDISIFLPMFGSVLSVTTAFRTSRGISAVVRVTEKKVPKKFFIVFSQEGKFCRCQFLMGLAS